MSFRRSALSLLAALAIAGPLAGCAGEPAKPFPHAIMTPAPKDLAAVTFTGDDGKPLSLDRFKGQWVWLYFGFTNCPDVCPAAMDYMAQEYKLLGKKDHVVPLFVSVDPARDDVKALKKYVQYYGDAFVGATADKPTLDAFAKEFGAGYVIDKPVKPGGHYNISHTNLVFVLDPQGRFVAAYVPSPTEGEMAKDFDKLRAS
jgi:protein SCO1/2